jgi:hypothetical protein
MKQNRFSSNHLKLGYKSKGAARSNHPLIEDLVKKN